MRVVIVLMKLPPRPEIELSGKPKMTYQALSFIAEFYEEWEDCEPEGMFFSQISPHLKPDTIRKIHTPAVGFSVIRSGFKASMLVKWIGACLAAP